MSREEYICKIKDLLNECDDLPLLDLVLKLLARRF